MMVDTNVSATSSISSPVPFLRIGQKEFNSRVYDLMPAIFQVHNELGHEFFVEDVYRNAVAIQLSEMGYAVESEVPVRLTFGGFVKEYFIDLLVDNSLLFEFKATEAIHASHRMQTLAYLLLAGLAHGKIVNMRPPSVEHEFVSTSIAPADRFRFTVLDDSWIDTGEESRRLRGVFCDLLRKWGVFLPVALYYEAIEHFFGGREQFVSAIDVKYRSQLIGEQQSIRIDGSSVLKISAFTQKPSDYGRRLQRFLRCTELEAVHWINFNHSQISLTTIRRS